MTRRGSPRPTTRSASGDTAAFRARSRRPPEDSLEPFLERTMTAKVIPEGKYADVGDGLKMHYLDEGPRDGKVIVFLHGSGPGASGYSNFKGNYPFFNQN